MHKLCEMAKEKTEGTDEKGLLEILEDQKTFLEGIVMSKSVNLEVDTIHLDTCLREYPPLTILAESGTAGRKRRPDEDEAVRRSRAEKARKEGVDRESLSENFNAEIDAWARRALAANGFGDY